MNPAIGWFCAYTPEEIILAAGLEPARILPGTGSASAADLYLHPNLCAYVRACLGFALEREPDLEGIVAVDSCDAMRRLFDVWRHALSPRFSHMLALPHLRTPEAVELFAAELKGLISALNAHFDLIISPDELHRGIEIMNEARSLLQRLSALRRSSLPGKRFYEILLGAMTRPKEEFNAWLREFLEEAEGAPSVSGGATRIVLSGGALDDPWIIEAIEQSGGQVVDDDLCCGSRYFDELTPPGPRPLEAIAQRYLFRPPCARMTDTDARVTRLIDLIERSGARGLIYYSVKFCDPHTLDWVPISEQLQSRGIPALRCETDFSESERERMKTRVEAFLEMLS